MQHTKEPWATEYRKRPDSMMAQEIFDVDGETIATLSWYSVQIDEKKIETNREANARRIVACVNACAGMDDPQIAISKLGYERDKAREERNIADSRIAELEAELTTEKTEHKHTTMCFDEAWGKIEWLRAALRRQFWRAQAEREKVERLREALINAKLELEALTLSAIGEDYNNPSLNEALAATEPTISKT